LLFVAAAPYLLHIDAVRRVAIQVVAPGLRGEVEIRRVALGWFSPVRLDDIRIATADGQRVVSVASIDGELPLWELLWYRDALGSYQVRQPFFELVFTEQGANFETLFEPPAEDEIEPPEEDRVPGVPITGSIELVDGGFSWLGRKSQTPWVVEGIDLNVALERPIEEGSPAPVLVVDRGRLIDHLAITPAMCDDALKYIAPSLAGATRAEGEFSIDLEPWRLPDWRTAQR